MAMWASVARPLESDGVNAIESVLRGGGEMGALMRSMDWSTTAIGKVDNWPQSLRSVLSILLASRHPIFVWWGRELVQFYNDAYRPMLGATKHPQAMGQRGRECWTEIWGIIGPMTEAVMQRGESLITEDGLLALDRNGYLEECYFTYAYSPIRDESGGIGGVFVACSESTERVLGERRLRTLRDLSARTSEQRTAAAACEEAAETLAANPHDIPFALLYLTDAGGDEARLAGATGIEAGSALAPPTIALEGAAAHRARWPIAAVLQTGSAVRIDQLAIAAADLPGSVWPETPSSALVLPLVKPGHDRPAGVLVAGLSPRRALDDHYRSFFELVAGQVAAAITNARAHEEEKQRIELLDELDRVKTSFFGNISHEFRTPLTLILGPLSEALRAPYPSLHGEDLRLAHRNGLRLLKLVNTLLDFSRIEASRLEARYEPTDLASLTRELASAFRSMVQSAGVAFIVDCAPLSEDVYVDRDAWEKIVLNLISNAFKFTLAGEIRVAMSEVGGRVVLSVSDTGSGIAAEEIPRVFERFHRVRGTRGRTQEGSGIGLALAHELVRRHNGTIAVTSAVGRGTTFTVSIPTGTGHLAADQVGTPSGRALTASGAVPYLEEARRWLPDSASSIVDEGSFEEDLSRLIQSPLQSTTEPRARILLVDDNVDMRAYLARLLGSRWEVEAVSDGAAALAVAREHPPALILTDAMMPGLDGFELIRELRASPATSAIPVIMLSARAGEEAQIQGLQAGADGYVVKPFSGRELIARIQSQIALAQVREAAEAYRAQLHDLFMHAPAAICVLRGPDHVFELANPLCLQIFGNRQVMGKPIREAAPELEDQEFFELIDQAFKMQVPLVCKERRVRFNRGEGEGVCDRYLTLVFQPVLDFRGRIEGVTIFTFEVTELVQARHKSEAFAIELQRETQRKDEFLAMLGHELRNPLAPIAAAVHVLELHRGEPQNEQALRALDVLARQVTQMTRVVDDLLDAARIRHGKLELKKTQLDLRAVISSAVDAIRPMIDERRQELTVAVPSGPLPFYADADRLGQVVSNLLSNASKYTEERGRIALSLDHRAGGAVITVRDWGTGISAELLPRVFDLFTQEDRSLARAQGGLGVGLALVRRLVELHGGTVHAASPGLGQGSEFTICLPDQDAPVIPSARPAGLAAPPRLRRRVLIVDDNEDSAQLLSMLLTAQGHVVHTADDGPAALDAARDFRPDVVLLDIGLPLMDGYEVASRLRGEYGRDGLLLIAVTGYGQDGDRRRAEEAGFDHHLVKPVDRVMLDALLNGLHAPSSRRTRRI